MITTRTLVLVVLAAAVFIAGTPALADTVAIVADAPGASFHAEDMAKYAEQLEQMKAEVSELQQTYTSLNGNSGVGGLFQNPQLKSMLPSDWQGVYSSVENGGYSGISGNVAAITASEQSSLGDGVAAQQANIVVREANLPVYNKAMGEEAYQAEITRLNNIEGLMSQIDSESDPKQTMDLQARIQAEQATIQNEQTKLQLMSMLQQSEGGLIQAQKNTVSQNILDAGNTNVPSIGN